MHLLVMLHQLPQEELKFVRVVLIKGKTQGQQPLAKSQSCWQYCGMSTSMALEVDYPQNNFRDSREVLAKLSTAKEKSSGIAWKDR